MKRGSRFIGFIMCTLLICLVIRISHAENALESLEGQSIPENARLTNVSLYNESAIVYEQTKQQLYVLRLTDGSVQAYPIWNDEGGDIWHEAILFSDGRDLLWAIEAEYGLNDDKLCLTGAALCQWRIEENGIERSKLTDIDLFDLVEDGGFQEQLPRFCNTMWEGDACYMLLERENSDQRELYRLSSDGSLSALPIEDVRALLRVEGGKIMYARAGESGSRIEVYNMETEKSELLFETQADLSRAYYSAEERSLYYIGDAVYKIEASRPDDIVPVGTCPIPQCRGMLSSNEHMVFYNGSQVSIRDVRNMNSVQSLSVAGWLGDVYTLYCEEYPSVLLRQTKTLSGYEITSNMLTHSSDVDVYILPLGDTRSYEALRDRGYCMPLTDPDVAKLADGFYEEIRVELLDGEGNICALPVDCSEGIALGVNVALWEELGFGDIPQTWDGFLEFLETDWRAYSRENADVRLLSYSSAEETQSNLFYMLKADYESYRKRNGTEEGYRSNVYQALLNRFLSIDFEAFQYGDDAASCLLKDWYSPRPSEITMRQTGSREIQYEYMPLSIVEGIRSEIVLYPLMAFINPYSQNLEAAQELMGFLAKHMDAEAKIMFQPDSNTAIKDEGYDAFIEMCNADIDRLKALYEAAEEVEKPQIQQAIQENEVSLQEYIHDGGYLISPDAIARYRKLISENGLSIQYLNESADSLNQVVELSKQLMQKQIGVEKYTNELDRILVQEELENQ